MEPAIEASRWTIADEGADLAREAWRETVFALADGWLGVRAGLEERSSPTDGAYMAGVFETTPIHYHERHPGFADSTDTRLAIVNGARVWIELDGERIGVEPDQLVATRRELDLRTGVVQRTTRWRNGAGAEVELIVQRVMTQTSGRTLALRLQLRSVSFSGEIALLSALDATRESQEQGSDSRIGASLHGGGLRVVQSQLDGPAPVLVQATQRSGVWVAAAQAHKAGPGLRRRKPKAGVVGIVEAFKARVSPGDGIWLEKTVTYAHGHGVAHPTELAALATTARTVADDGFARLVADRFSQLDDFWARADVRIDGDPNAERALRFNLFQLHQSTSRDPLQGTAAKGLTGEGYEGHIFWDTEAFILPALVFTDPPLARQALVFRWSQLEGARETARALNHGRGALFPWRTIAGRECSAHYPSGSAQYHINGAVAQAIELYMAASDDQVFLLDHGAEMLFETARLWMDVGRYSPRHGDRFCIFGVTGPDEYSVLVDNNFYTNKLAASHLAYAAATARRLTAQASDAFNALADRLGLADNEVEAWARAAGAIYLPRDEALGVDAQDDGFLSKPAWPFDLSAADHSPLLLECHPMTLYRHQICKQADLIQAMAFNGDEVPRDRLRRNFDYYEAVTTHDFTLSACPFAIVAARAGLPNKALNYFRKNVLIDLGDLHGNASHGSHMAALAGSWLTIAFGFAGLTWRGGRLSFRPVLPDAWQGLRFRLNWKSSRLEIAVSRDVTTYTLVDGAAVSLDHNGRALVIEPGRPVVCTTPSDTQVAA